MLLEFTVNATGKFFDLFSVRMRIGFPEIRPCIRNILMDIDVRSVPFYSLNVGWCIEVEISKFRVTLVLLGHSMVCVPLFG